MWKSSRTWLLLALLAPFPALADSVGEDVRAAVEAYYADLRSDQIDSRESLSEHGALQFWSSGGLVLSVAKSDRATEYDSFDLYPKHISVIPLSETSATALYYLEGSMTPKGSEPVAHYLTRVLEVFVLEEGGWKRRAGHWSALRGGAGTSQSVD